jgi:hypothetical protein
MSDSNKIVMFTEEYENEKSGEKVPGVTVLIDGKFKQTLDIIMQKEGEYSNYTEIVRDLLFTGVDSYISKYK